MNQEFESKLDRLGDLYALTGDDWELVVHHTLTEPTCPTVIIRREQSNSTKYRVDRDTIEEGIKAAVDLVYRDVVLGQEVESEAPFTNSDDHPDDPRWHNQPDIASQLIDYDTDDPRLRSLLYRASDKIEELRNEVETLKIKLSQRRKDAR